MKSDTHHRRIHFLFGVFFVIALVFIGKLYLVQIVQHDSWDDRADRQFSLPSGRIFDRGTIFFQDKAGERISAATLASGLTLAILPDKLEDPSDAYDKLSAIVAIDKDEFMEKAAKKGDPYEMITRRIDAEDAEQILSLGIGGVVLEKERWRLYPGDERAANTIGFVGFDGDDLVGRYGLEQFYEEVLQRRDEKLYKNIFVEVFSGVQDVAKARENEARGDVVTSIEPNVQSYLEGLLTGLNEELSPRSLGGVIMDPMTGEIVALAILPTFDPNEFYDVEDPHVFGNPVVESIFEMGSIIKPLTIAAGLDAGVITPQSTYNDRGFVEANGRTIWNHDAKGRGPGTSIQTVLGESLNTGVAHIVSLLGNKKFADYMRAYGLDQETGIDLPGEVRGKLGNLDTSRDIEYITASYGQGIALTPIATVRALAALGNGGKLVVPHIATETISDLGIAKTLTRSGEKQVLSPETSETITRMLVEVVDKYLLGGTIKKDNYAIAAKTGTAQVTNPATGKYYEDRFFHSFFGYFPAYNPRFIIFFYADDPKGTNFASQTFTLPFRDTVDFLINYYEIPPDRQQQ
ncbi:MAG: cell division protein FtsI [Candidatus Campbellbacteria bacterium]